jgi:hypothetical protein
MKNPDAGDSKPLSRVFLVGSDKHEPFETEAARAYARAFNSLDPAPLIPLLDEDCVYESQYVFDALRGKESVVEYFRGKLKTIKEAGKNAEVFAQLGTMREIYPGRPCVLMAQGDHEKPTGLVLFQTEGEKIKRIDMCGALPTPDQAEGSGEYPA